MGRWNKSSRRGLYIALGAAFGASLYGIRGPQLIEFSNPFSGAPAEDRIEANSPYESIASGPGEGSQWKFQNTSDGLTYFGATSADGNHATSHRLCVSPDGKYFVSDAPQEVWSSVDVEGLVEPHGMTEIDRDGDGVVDVRRPETRERFLDRTEYSRVPEILYGTEIPGEMIMCGPGMDGFTLFDDILVVQFEGIRAKDADGVERLLPDTGAYMRGEAFTSLWGDMSNNRAYAERQKNK